MKKIIVCAQIVLLVPMIARIADRKADALDIITAIVLAISALLNMPKEAENA